MLLSIYCRRGLLWVEEGWRRSHKKERSVGKLMCYHGWQWHYYFSSIAGGLQFA
jgi:hypothetical protein